MLADVAAAPLSCVKFGTGAATAFQLVPFQCWIGEVVSPTAHTLFEAVVATPKTRIALITPWPLVTRAQAPPLDFMVRVVSAVAREKPPAHRLVAELAATALRVESDAGRPSNATFQAVPLQCRTRDEVPEEEDPTAQALVFEVAITPSRTVFGGFGLGTDAHDVPLKWRVTPARVWGFDPTAHTLDPELAPTALSM